MRRQDLDPSPRLLVANACTACTGSRSCIDVNASPGAELLQRRRLSEGGSLDWFLFIRGNNGSEHENRVCSSWDAELVQGVVYMVLDGAQLDPQSAGDLLV